MNRIGEVLKLLKMQEVISANLASADSAGVSGFEVRFHGIV
jgi:hypothetical protein